MQYRDWGERSSQWAEIRSETLRVRGVAVHYLAADARPEAGSRAPAHLLVHAMAGSASAWLDLIPPLTVHGRVIAPDLPGTLAGHTSAPTRRGPRAETNAAFLRAFVGQAGLDRLVVHGWSMGGLVSAYFADLMPDRVVGLVLTAPTLPWQRTSQWQALGWHTFGRAMLAVGTPLARTCLRVAGPRLLRAKLQRFERRLEEARAASDLRGLPRSRRDLMGGDLSRMSPELQSVLLEDGLTIAAHPERLPGVATALASAMSAMFVDQCVVQRTLDRIQVPVLLLWGDDDPLVDQASLHQHALRPGWHAHVVPSTGHLLPVEEPDDYVDAVGTWLARHRLA